MIFPTLTEAKRVMGIIEHREKFCDLTFREMNVIQGMYKSIEALERTKSDCETVEEVEILNICINSIEMEIAETYVSFTEGK